MNENIVNDVYVSNGEEIEFNYYANPHMDKKISFVKSVVDTVVNDECYYSMLKDMVFDFFLVEFFSDIEVEVPEQGGIDYVEEFLANNNAPTVIKLGMDFDVLQELYDCVDKGIEYKTGIHPSPIADSIAKLLDTVEKKFADIDVVAMTEMAKVFGKLQGDITPDKMLDAYAKSDIFKKQHEDAVKKQKKRDKKADERVADANLNVVKGNVSFDASEIGSTKVDKNLELV